MSGQESPAGRMIPLRPRSAFDPAGYAATIEALAAEARQLYLADGVPWVVGYSGGKDSTATLQLVWHALAGLPPGQRGKAVHVISTDTGVENPVVAAWVGHSLEVMAAAAERQGLPVRPHRLTPAIVDSFWVNLVGRGYAAPRPKFRWCTDRLKIRPSTAFLRDVAQGHGEAILVLGTRKSESAGRGRRMAELEGRRTRDLLSPGTSQPGCLVYTPLENWSSDDVWTYLMQSVNPWGITNKDLLGMYQGASPDGECPLVVDNSTPSCGDSRFGCWVCTLVSQDKSMTAMIQNDTENDWMLPLLELRNALDVPDDRHLRDFRRMNGRVQLFHDRPIPGPYTQQARQQWLRMLLDAQTWIRRNGPAHVQAIELISLAELEEIRRIWVCDKHEFEDALPGIYAAATGENYPGPELGDGRLLHPEILDMLGEITGGDRLHYELVRDLLDIEQQHHAQVRRRTIFDGLEQALRRGFYYDADDAVDRARKHAAIRERPPGAEQA
jgi:DNA sulfur modification protein DndC